MKPVLVLQLRPEDETSDNEFAAFLKYGELTADRTRRIRIEKAGIPELDIDDYSAILVGGSPFDISTPQQEKSDIQLKIEADFSELLSRVVAEDFPFLGACSGCGLLGSYLDTPISQKYGEPVSCIVGSLTAAGMADPLLAQFPQEIDVMVGHKEACDFVPQGAQLLIRGTACEVQMFRVGENVYATQFHPEADSEGFCVRINAYKNHGYFAPEEADALKARINTYHTPFAQTILKRFIHRYAG